MRVLLVLLALVATPFLVGAAQGLGHDAQHCAARIAKNKKDKPVNKCDETPPPPPSCVSSAPSTAGTASIDGKVYLDASPWSGLAGWCVQLTGTVTATAVTDASGAYRFSGLPAGTYTVCEDQQSGWSETFPSASYGAACPTGFGWTFTLDDATGASFVNFGNVTP